VGMIIGSEFVGRICRDTLSKKRWIYTVSLLAICRRFLAVKILLWIQCLHNSIHISLESLIPASASLGCSREVGVQAFVYLHRPEVF
jgi:hypothetical protein